MAKYISSLFLCGLNGVVASGVALESMQTALARYALGTAALVLVAFVLRASRRSRGEAVGRLAPKSALLLAASGASAGIACIFLFEAYTRIGVGQATLLYFCGPLIVMASSPLLLHERITVSGVVCIAVVFAGACLVSGAAIAGGADLPGVVCGCLAALFYAPIVILGKMAEGIDGADRAAIVTGGSLVAVLVCALATGSAQFAVPAGSWGHLLCLGLVNTALEGYLYYSSFTQVKAQSIAVCGYIDPLVAVVSSAAILGEHLGPLKIFGGMLILGGALAHELFAARRSAAEEDAPGCE